MGLNIEEQKAVDRFRKDIVEPSMTQLVILDFWAEWCGPCKALAPVLEKVAAEYADKGVVLAKINVDEEQFIASQFQVRSIPTVYAMFQGQPVADLTQARSESQLKATLDKLLEQLPVQSGAEAPQPDIAPHLAMAEEALAAGDAEQAAGILMQVLQVAPDSLEALAGLARCFIASDRLDEAAQVLESVPAEQASDPQVERARKALELARSRPEAGELASLRATAEANPADMDAQFAFASAAYAAGERDAAAATLLKMVAIDREWNESAARTKLLEIFEAVGLEDPWVSATRRKLSTVLFG
ncbi:tetratricopeptide repeat protein [Novosphingobium profundi]|uniref:tetratricopeptide repeat protein n=1 Tax=Novosphingobium profundi TaxID=1774954 RepID=UPI001BD9F6F5|nr:tetratricopeptide repeat protein [Novosphingobium profundi]MBT0667894.1 tetratricopeptide repeat protein [Novosphingobium profundi]